MQRTRSTDLDHTQPDSFLRSVSAARIPNSTLLRSIQILQQPGCYSGALWHTPQTTLCVASKHSRVTGSEIALMECDLGCRIASAVGHDLQNIQRRHANNRAYNKASIKLNRQASRAKPPPKRCRLVGATWSARWCVALLYC